jgi:hypothetical protein
MMYPEPSDDVCLYCHYPQRDHDGRAIFHAFEKAFAQAAKDSSEHSYDVCANCRYTRAEHLQPDNKGPCEHFEKAESSHMLQEMPAVRCGMGESVPLAYSAPKLEKLSLEERLLEHAANWHMVRARLLLIEKKFQEDPLTTRESEKEIEAFYRFCVTLMKG